MACSTCARHQTHKRCLSRRARQFDHSVRLSVRSTVDARRVDVVGKVVTRIAADFNAMTGLFFEISIFPRITDQAGAFTRATQT